MIHSNDHGTDALADGPSANAKGGEAYRLIRQAIDDGRYAPGSALKEVAIAGEIGMSRTPVREALRQLQRDGAVTLVPNRGAIVRSLSVHELDDIYTLRAVLEGFCASRAATRMDAPAVGQLSELQDEFERLALLDGDEHVERLIRLNAIFHQTIVAASRNRRAREVLDAVMDVPLALQRSFWRSKRAREITSVYHREIVEAIRARDAVRAEAVMRSHVYAIKDDFIEQQRAAGIQSLIDEASA